MFILYKIFIIHYISLINLVIYCYIFGIDFHIFFSSKISNFLYLYTNLILFFYI